MVAAVPVPLDEAARLEVLEGYAIMDTPPDERFDLFTRVATWVHEVPVSAVNFVGGERTFFKSLIGLQTYEPKRSTSLCAHAVGGPEGVMVVEDLAADSRFSDHPLLLVRGVRFYAGAPIHSPCGHALGTLCIGDVVPRRFCAEGRGRLAALAAGVGAVLELHRTGARLLQAATRDALTGLCNRLLFDRELTVAVERARTRQGPGCALLYVDLDGFKQVNDQWGHAVGDALLVEVGRRLSRVARRGDLVARLAGDEFVVLMPELAAPEAADHLARRLLAALSSPFAFEGVVVPVGASIGVAICPRDAVDGAQLLHHADVALYDAKRAGRGQHRMHRPKLALVE